MAYVELRRRAEPSAGITVVLPSFVPRHLWERLLHNQHVLSLSSLLRRRPGVKVTEFPFGVQG
jgi:hypothetical protein